MKTSKHVGGAKPSPSLGRVEPSHPGDVTADGDVKQPRSSDQVMGDEAPGSGAHGTRKPGSGTQAT